VLVNQAQERIEHRGTVSSWFRNILAPSHISPPVTGMIVGFR